MKVKLPNVPKLTSEQRVAFVAFLNAEIGYGTLAEATGFDEQTISRLVVTMYRTAASEGKHQPLDVIKYF